MKVTKTFNKSKITLITMNDNDIALDWRFIRNGGVYKMVYDGRIYHTVTAKSVTSAGMVGEYEDNTPQVESKPVLTHVLIKQEEISKICVAGTQIQRDWSAVKSDNIYDFYNLDGSLQHSDVYVHGKSGRRINGSIKH